MAKQKAELSYEESLAALEAEYAEKRRKLTASLTAPLKQERADLIESQREIHRKLGEIDKEIAKIEGRTLKPVGAKAASGKKRLSAVDKLPFAQAAYDKLIASPKTRFKGEDLSGDSGILGRELVRIWNEANHSGPFKKIQHEGDKAARRYFVG